MKREERNRKLSEEIPHIPRGDLNQNFFRARYNMMRRHDLSINPTMPARESLLKALEEARKDSPNFSPFYDSDFFRS